MSSTLPSPVALDDERHRRLTIAGALLYRVADQLERLSNDRSLADDHRQTVDEALHLALIAREELER